MNVASELLSSPCGYYGELILQDLRSPIAAAVMATEQMIAPKERINEFRSHFNGLRILEQEAGWCCEARITLPKLEATTHAWLPFAELRVADAAERPTSQGAVLIPQYSEPDRTPEDEASFAKWQEAEKKKVASSKLLTSAIRGLFPWVMPNLIPSQGELHFGLNSSGPNRAMSEWLSKNDKHLAQLQAADVDRLLKDLAAHLASAYSTIGHEAAERPPSFGIFLEDCADVFRFIARVFRLHWFLGHDDWAGVLDTIDGAYPQSRPPSLAWAASVRSDDFDYPDLEAAGFARAWLWPWFYQQTCKIDQQFDASVYFADRTYTQDHACHNRYALGTLGEWWTMIEHDALYVPYLVPRGDAEGLHPGAAGVYSYSEELWDFDESWERVVEHYGCERHLTAEWFHQVADYKGLVFDLPSWDVQHHRAFPAVGENLSIHELFQKDRLGFALRRFETEIEGDKAWDRLVKNAVFDDSFGLQAIASRVSKYAESHRFKHFRANAHVHSFKEKSDEIQRQLQQLVKAALLQWHGDEWRDIGIPSEVLECIRKRKPKADSIDEVFREVVLLDYMKILVHPPNWENFKSYVGHVGFEPPNQKSFKKMISKWNIARNRAAHVEKSDSISYKDIEELDETKSRILMWWLMLGANPQPPRP